MFKKYTIILCVLVLASFNAKSQVIITNDTIRHETFAGETAADFVDIDIHTKIKNNKNKPDTFVWTRNENNLPSLEWTSAVCDINLCWGSSVNTAQFILKANDSGALSFHFYPKNICGTGKMVVRFSRLSNPLEYTDVVATGKAWCRTNVVSNTISTPIIYPNPSQGYFTLKSDVINNGVLKIYTIQGKLITSEAYNSGDIYNTNAFVKGLYILTFSDTKNTVSSKITIE